MKRTGILTQYPDIKILRFGASIVWSQVLHGLIAGNLLSFPQTPHDLKDF